MKRSLLLIAAMAALSLPLAGGAQTKLPQGHPKASSSSSMTTEEALKQAPKLNTALAPLAKTFDASAAKLKKSPKDAAVKKAYVEAAYTYGHKVMVDRGGLPPTVQYRASLALFRKALAVDPKHKPSLDDKKQIEDVYVSMGMPIPK